MPAPSAPRKRIRLIPRPCPCREKRGRGIGIYFQIPQRATGFEEFLTARSKKSNKFLYQSLFFLSFFDCEPKVRFDFEVHFLQSIVTLKEFQGSKKTNADALVVDPGYVMPHHKF
jgi:hypothetical protein